MSRIELQVLLEETKTHIHNLIKQGQLREAAFAMDALVVIQADLIRALLKEINQ